MKRLFLLISLALAAALAGCGGGAEPSAAPVSFAQVQAQGNPSRAPAPPAAAQIFDLADVLQYIVAFHLYDPPDVYRAAQVASLSASQLDGIYGLAPGAAAAYIAAQGWAPLPGGSTVIGLGLAQPTSITTTTSLAYGRTVSFTVTGNNLSAANLVFATDTCYSPTWVAGGSGNARTVVCTVGTTGGTMTVQARTPGGTVLVASTLTVPQPQVTLSTNQGTVVIELNPAKAPATVNNFLTYANAGYYSGLLFHRVIPGFMIQGGGFTSGMVPKGTLAPITLESNNGLSNLRGTIAMARTSDPNSATSQFFINHVDNLFLNYSSASAPGYAVFGRVVSGLEVVDRIAAVPTRTVGQFADVPQTDVVILSAQQTR